MSAGLMQCMISWASTECNKILWIQDPVSLATLRCQLQLPRPFKGSGRDVNRADIQLHDIPSIAVLQLSLGYCVGK